MRLAAVTIVRNECDIIEAFTRHAATLFDRMYVIDNISGDATAEILRRLVAEGLPLVLGYDANGPFYQGTMTTELIRRAISEEEWDFIFPLDGDEFLTCSRVVMEHELSRVREDSIGLMVSDQYVPTELDDRGEPDPVRRIVHRAVTEPRLEPKMGKAVIPGWVASHAEFAIGDGNHDAYIEGQAVPTERFEQLRIAHFPVRSEPQFIVRVVVSRLAWLARADYHLLMGWHLGEFYDRIKLNCDLTMTDLTNAALFYVDTYLVRDPKTYRKLIVRDPFSPSYEALRYLNLAKIEMLARIMEMAELLARSNADPVCA